MERVVYILQSRIGRRGKRTKRDHWQTEGAYLTPSEAEAFARAHKHWYFHGWRVSAVPASESLARRIGEGMGI